MVTRQRKWQRARTVDGECIICGDVAVTKLHCKFHREQHNERQLEYYHERKKKLSLDGKK